MNAGSQWCFSPFRPHADSSKSRIETLAIMGVLSKMVGLTSSAVVNVAAAIVRILHLSSVLPSSLRLNKSAESTDGAELATVLHDGDEYVSTLVIETCDREPVEREEYINTVKIETIEPDNEESIQEKKPQGSSDEASATSSSCHSPLGSLEPEEEVIELSDEDDVPIPISRSTKAIADKLGAVPPCTVNVVAFAESRGYHDHKGGNSATFAVVEETRADMQPHTTTIKGIPYVPTTGGSMVIAPELIEAEAPGSGGVELRKAGEQSAAGRDRFSDSTSVETNATEATEDDRLRGLSELIEPDERQEEDLTQEEAAGDGAAATLGGLSGARSLSGASSLSSMVSSEEEDNPHALRSGVPGFIPPLGSASASTVTL